MSSLLTLPLLDADKFLSCLELKELQTTYHNLIVKMQGILNTHVQQQQQEQSWPRSLATSPSFLTSLSKPKSHHRSNAIPEPGPSSTLTTSQHPPSF